MISSHDRLNSYVIGILNTLTNKTLLISP